MSVCKIILIQLSWCRHDTNKLVEYKKIISISPVSDSQSLVLVKRFRFLTESYVSDFQDQVVQIPFRSNLYVVPPSRTKGLISKEPGTTGYGRGGNALFDDYLPSVVLQTNGWLSLGLGRWLFGAVDTHKILLYC